MRGALGLPAAEPGTRCAGVARCLLAWGGGDRAGVGPAPSAAAFPAPGAALWPFRPSRRCSCALALARSPPLRPGGRQPDAGRAGGAGVRLLIGQSPQLGWAGAIVVGSITSG